MSNAIQVTKVKDPEEDLDYTWSFDSVLDDDESIVSYEFHDTPEAIELHDEAASDRAVTAWVGPGGTAGTDYYVACSVVTDSTPPRTYDRSIRFRMRNK